MNAPVTFARGILLLTMAATIALIGSVLITLRTGTTSWSGGFEVTGDRSLTVTVVRTPGPVAGLLMQGDRLLTINGSSLVDNHTLLQFGRALGRGARLEVERDGRPTVVQLPPLQIRTRSIWRTLRISALPAVVLLLSGAIVGILRPQLRAAELFSLASLLAVLPVATSSARITQAAGALTPLEDWFVNICHLVSPLHLAPALLFVASFPERPMLRGVWRALLQATLAALGAAWALSVAMDWSEHVWPQASIWMTWSYPRLWATTNGVVEFVPPLAFAVMAAIVILKYFGTPEAADRNRLRWMIGGTVAGVMPMSIYYLAVAIANATGRGDLPEWTTDVSSASLLLMPIVVAYAVARHKLFDIRIVVGRGLQYLLARNLLRAALTISIALLAFQIARDPDAPLRAIVARSGVWIAFGLTASLLYFRASLFSLLDRHFLRPALYSEPLVVLLIDEISRQETREGITEVLTKHLDRWLHPSTISVLFRDHHSNVFTSSSTPSGRSPLQLSADGPVLQQIEHTGKAARVGIGPAAATPTPEFSDIDLLVPIGGGERPLMACLLLGSKQSEAPYSEREIHLLELAAAQVLVVLENADLRAGAHDARKAREQILAHLDQKEIDLLQECPACGTCYGRDPSVCAIDKTPLTFTHPVEHVIDDRWQLERRLGAGGMGTVYGATDLRLDRSVALKLMRGSSLDDERARRRFEREARTLSRLQHPAIVTLYEYGCASPGGSYLVMELVSGTTLRSQLRRGRIAPQLVGEWFEPILDGIGYAHRHGVIHRDLKPENILITSAAEGGTPKILDFGLARYRFDELTMTTLTRSGMMVGTLAYMAPEQLAGQPADERSDIFAIGVMLAEALLGAHPFVRPTMEATLAAITSEPIRLPPGAGELQSLLNACAAKTPADRFADCIGLKAALIPALKRCPPVELEPRALPANYEVDEASTQVDGPLRKLS